MIPKIIHYCWFGGKPKPDDVVRCLASWRRCCPDYEIREWNESNFPVRENAYCCEAYEAKKWAFVSDYARVKILHDYGGIYLDTDVEVVRSFDPLLGNQAFMCFESDKDVSIGTFGAKKGADLLGRLLEYYDNRHFVHRDGTYDTTPNLSVITDILVNAYGLKLNGRKQVLQDNILVLPMEAFIAKSYHTGWIMKNDQTFAIHHYSASWWDAATAGRHKRYQQRMQENMKRIEPYVDRLTRLQILYEDGGFMGCIQRLREKAMKQMFSGGGHKLPLSVCPYWYRNTSCISVYGERRVCA